MMHPPDAERTILDGRFEIESLLGSGGMADVFRATDLRHNRAVAVKILRSDVLDTIGVERFRREINVTAAFTHQNILALLESGETTDADGKHVLYYVMPLIAGETIRDRIAREGRFPLEDALRITREVLEALQYAHAQGVIHRDIKPANVLLSGAHAVVADFGIARPILRGKPGSDDTAELTVSGIALGTPAYMSPEQAFGGQVVDARCDIYAAACVLYEMLTAMPPFDANTGQAIMARKVNGTFVPASVMRPGLPALLDDILARALRPEPADRFASATAFLNAIDMLNDPSLSASGGMARLPPARLPWHRRRGLIASAVAIPVIALAGWGLAQWAATGEGNGPAAPDPARVAVMPFENISADTSLAYVANGFTTDLIDELAQVRALTVISKNGVLPFRGMAVGVDSVARALRVGSVITGDVRRNGDLVSVSVRLVDGTGEQVVSHDTSGTLDDLLGVRSVILADVVRFLRERLGEQVQSVASRRRARSAEAWELVERVRIMREGELDDPELTREARRRRTRYADSLMVVAAGLDRQWSEPLLQRAYLASQQALYEELAGLRGERGAEVGIDAARQHWNAIIRHSDGALARDATDAKALRMRGRARASLWRTSTGTPDDALRTLAEADLRAAVELRPDLSEAWSDLSSLLELAGDFVQAEQAAAAALRADEYLLNAPEVLQRLQFTALGAEKFDAAASWCSEGRRRYPADSRFIGCELTILGWTGSTRADVGKAWTALQDAEQRFTDPDVMSSGWAIRRLFVASVAARAGLRDSALAIVARTRADMPRGASQIGADYNEARVMALLGQSDDALRLLETYLTRFPIRRRHVARMPWFQALRADPRFVALTATP